MAMERRGRQATAPATEEAVTLHLDSELPHIRRAPGGLVLGGSSVPTRNTRIEEVRCLSVQMSFILSARSVPLIRTSVRRIADAWGFDALLIDDVELIASELSANVVLHSDAAGCTCFDVRLAPCPCGLRIEVSDGSPRLPSVEQSKSTSEHGRGLFLVEAVCRRWGVEEGGSGKVVWAEVGAEAA
ncbi:ATP-binding protein [Kitasatospora sp. NBC_01250]|uniref:ATP-binding protein n=1 Tax=Kitasatospora sp. NBC_01250 TaxID=2903571 RepID=UPI002E31443B|nr:ATP-binding protein [Kitasatospora sp. NBC_01250]